MAKKKRVYKKIKRRKKKKIVRVKKAISKPRWVRSTPSGGH